MFALSSIVEKKGEAVTLTSPLVYMGGQIGTLEIVAKMVDRPEAK